MKVQQSKSHLPCHIQNIQSTYSILLITKFTNQFHSNRFRNCSLIIYISTIIPQIV
ncbi:unnamed protein product [Brassica rapa subsp. trilocularis]